MRTLIVRAAIATVFVPVAASAQSLSLTESEALTRLSADSPARPGDPRVGRMWHARMR